MNNGQKIFIAILAFIIIIYWAYQKQEKSIPNEKSIPIEKSTISSTDYSIIDKGFTDEGGEYTRLVVWVYTNNMTKNIDIAKKIEKDFPASRFTKKKMWLSINFFTDKSINKIDPEFGDKIKQFIKIDTYSGKIVKNEISPK